MTEVLDAVDRPFFVLVGIAADRPINNLDRDENAARRFRAPYFAEAALANAFENEIHSWTSHVPVFNVQTVDDAILSSQQPRRVGMVLLISFSIAALVLTAMGLYGVIAYLVEQRTNEIGIRMALGALPRDILKMILGYGAALALGGIAVGLLATFALTQLMRTLLYGVASTDPLTYAIVAAVIFGIALIACSVPARRAMRVDPMIALRYE